MSASSTRISSPSANPNSNLVSASTIPRSRARAAANSYRVSVSSFKRSASPRPTRSAVSSREMLTSCPVDSFVAGVKMGSGRRSDSLRPLGRPTPHTRPVSRYSFHPEPDRYPRATHSIGTTSARRTSMARPASHSRSSAEDSGNLATSAVSRWLATMCDVRSNQKRDRPVRTRPLSGIAWGRTTSNAEIRSVATISRSSPASKMSRTFPRACRSACGT